MHRVMKLPYMAGSENEELGQFVLHLKCSKSDECRQNSFENYKM